MSNRDRAKKRNRRWTVHHINGKADDNRPTNLEWRRRAKHPHGIGLNDAIKILEANGYYCSPVKGAQP